MMLSINRRQTTHDTLSIFVEHEGHVLGNIVQSYSQKNPKIKYAGYRKHNPLIDKIEIKTTIESNKEDDFSELNPIVVTMKESVECAVSDVSKLIESINV